MDMTSHIELQFQTLTSPTMDQQISLLQQRAQRQEPTATTQSPIDRQTHFQPNAPYSYNPQADYLNNQLQQMSRQMPDSKNSIALQMQNMNSMHDLPNMPAVDPLNFQRPSSSNTRAQGY